MSASHTITCPRCGERLPEGFTRCDACGAYLVPHPGGPTAADSKGTSAAATPTATKRESAMRRAPTPAPARGAPWLYLVVGLVVGGAVGFALHSAVGPRQDGGAPSGPADIMAGAGAPGGGEAGGGMGAAPPGGGMGAGAPPGGGMPAEVAAQVKQFRSALMMDPNDLQANIGLGNLMFDSNQWEKAIDLYSKALEIDPKNADVRVDRAIAYHSIGQNPKAKEEMLRVTREHPDHRNAWLNLGVVSGSMGDKATAIRAWEQYLKLDPNGTHAAAIRDELKRLRQGG